jgi:uncharacterized protein (TIGR02246 family)
MGRDTADDPHVEPPMNTEAVEAIAGQVLGRLEAAWNAADGRAFGAPFAADAEFVAIRGDHHHGREAVTHGHQALFDSIYRGSRVGYEVLQARALTDDVILVLAQVTLNAPTGPLAGESRSTATLVLVRLGDAWPIAAFHNTLVAPPQAG